MSLDKSLKSKDMLERHRNVLSRAERIEHLKDIGAWPEDASPFGLPKVAHRKAAVGKKTKTKKAEATEEKESKEEKKEE
ncbi:MAG: small basic protein [Phycisphaerales bacterium]|nr:MAG: small basic protein [Phycisphaerales bacterium]